MKKTYKIDVDCANCANKMEAAAQKTPGVKNATVNFMTLKMSVEFEEGQDHKAVMQQVYANCFSLLRLRFAVLCVPPGRTGRPAGGF